MLAIVAPGQGAQKSGFLTPWLERPSFADGLDWLGAVTGLDLRHYGTEADDDTIRDTAVAQPLLVAAGLLAGRELLAGAGIDANQVGVFAGHSVGEIPAAVWARVLSPEAGMVLVRERGRAMAEASAVTATSMTAVLGGNADDVLAAIDAAGLTAANNNGPGQIVAAGTVEQLQAFTDNPPERARLIPLSVAGAFHTVHMEPAVEHLARLARGVAVSDPVTTLLTNADGSAVTSGREVVDGLVRQVANPVRWDLCMQQLAELGVTGLLEVPPAGTLTGIAKRHLKGVELLALKTPDQLDEAQQFVARHTTAPAEVS